ncbi:epsin-2 [Trichonephila clavipes]|nr:epsin-2 [Trichonephila clavipes]
MNKTILCAVCLVTQQCRENLFAIQTLKDFQYVEEGKDQGINVREKAKQLVALLKDDERLKAERNRALKARERFARSTTHGTSGHFGLAEFSQRSSDEEMSPTALSDLEQARPQTAGEEELQLQLALAMSKEEAEQSERLKRNDDLRLQMALSKSEEETKTSIPHSDSAMNDLLGLSLQPDPWDSKNTDIWNHSLPEPNLNLMQNDPWSPVSEGAFPSPSESQQHVCVSMEEGVPSLDAFLGQQSDLICSRPRNAGTAIRGFSSGRPRETTPADDPYIVLQARRNRRQTAGEIARHTTQATGRPISRFTVARRLHGGGLFARRPVRCVPLTPAHRRRRSLWCRKHRNWRDNVWGRVLFTDESRFSLSSDSHRILIWRERGSRNHPSNIIERDRYGGRGVLVWGGIMLGSRTDLHIFDAGSVNGTRYCNEILLPYVCLF